MSAQGKTGSNKGKGKERKPVVLSKNEALYPPDPRALKAAIIVIAVLVIITIAYLVANPLW